MGFWQLGNTSVRSAMRMKEGLTALSTSNLQGNIRKEEGDIAFRRLLGECGVVSLGEDSTNSVGRKWRAALGKLGFLYPRVTKTLGFLQEELGQPDTITPAGWDLIRAQTVAATQECFLRAMTAPVFPDSSGNTFSPLCWTLAVLLELERQGAEPALSFVELARIMQTTVPSDGLGQTVTRLLELRSSRKAADSKRVFDRQLYASGSEELHCNPNTFVDYADMNIRYLKATGMVQSKGKGVALVPEKHGLAVQLTKKLLCAEPLLRLYRSLCGGFPLPIDHAPAAYQILEELLDQAKRYGISYSLIGRALDTPVKINQARYELEELVSEKKEEVYATEQSKQWQEIAAYMKLIAARKDRGRIKREHSFPYETVSHEGDMEISIPRAEAPAYLEWSLWRACLALGGLVNKPYAVRRFKIDQDFLPVSTAPGNGPDLIAEFEHFVIAIEVTLSESSRQEAMEGEPVRRHVADLTLQYDKPVYGLFLANRVDSNTAETFRIGVWYTHEDQKLELRVIPVTLSRFAAYFEALFRAGKAAPQKLVELLESCGCCRRDFDAPHWKLQIELIVENAITALN